MSRFDLEPLRSLASGRAGVEVSVAVRPDGEPATELDAGAVLPVASVGKVLLLIETARQIEAGVLDLGEELSRESVEPVGDSGLWQHLAATELQIGDVATLVASVSDNLATNVLLARVGLEAVDETRSAIGLRCTRLLDVVRDERGAADAARLATGSAAELADLMERLGGGAVVSPDVSRTVLGWLATNVDQSMVGAGFGLDPLAHAPGAGRLQLYNKTGSDRTVRAEIGLLRGPQRRIAYAVIASWTAADPPSPGEVVGAMRDLGTSIRLEV